MYSKRGQRHHSGGSRLKKAAPSDVNNPIIKAFLEYQQLLDTRHDKYERLVKLSRDITIDSKRVIFLLHRGAGSDDLINMLSQASEKLENVRKEKFAKIAEELIGEDPYQFLRAYSPGLQEYIEAVTFHHFLDKSQLVKLTDIQVSLTFPHQDSTQQIAVHVPPVEYMLGVADLTGELMRLTINSVGAGDLQIPFAVCSFLRKINEGFMTHGNAARELNRKMSTLRQSLQKVENACYTIEVRGSEIPKHMLADVLSGPDFSTFHEDNSVCDD